MIHGTLGTRCVTKVGFLAAATFLSCSSEGTDASSTVFKTQVLRRYGRLQERAERGF